MFNEMNFLTMSSASGAVVLDTCTRWRKQQSCTKNTKTCVSYYVKWVTVNYYKENNYNLHLDNLFKVILYSYLILKKMNERITDS